jgi:hypothetical protein
MFTVTFIFGEKMFVKNDTEHKAFSRTFGCIYVNHIFRVISVMCIVLKKMFLFQVHINQKNYPGNIN